MVTPARQSARLQLDLVRYQLLYDGRPVHLERQPMELLILLAKRQGELVSREDIAARLWGDGVFVDPDQSINRAIRKLRLALRDDPEHPKFLETVVGKGYRFSGDIEITEPATGTDQDSLFSAPDPISAPTLAAPHRSYRWVLFSVLLIVVAMVAAALFWSRHITAPDVTRFRSVVVLPLENLSDDPDQDYFADGMTDELITDLAKIGSLRVISRTSAMQYKRTHKSLSQIARELNVDAVVEGTVTREGNRVRITAQLIHATTDKHLWAEEYEGDLNDILKLQSQVALAIKNEIQIKLTPQEDIRLANAAAVNPEAHEAYLKGRYYLEKLSRASTKEAISYFQQAIKKDPNFAPAYAGLAECYMQWSPLPREESVAKAKAAAMKAMELDETLGEAHASLALIGFMYDWNLPEAEREFKRAIDLNPSYGEAHHLYSHYLMQMGRTEEALTESNRFLELDPLSPTPNLHLGWSYLFAGKYDQAIGQLQKTLQMDPNNVEAHSWLGQTYEQKKMYQDALAELQKALGLSGGDAQYRALLGHAYAVSGKRDQAQAILAELQATSPVSPYETEIAIVYTGLGDRDKAFDWLGKAFERRSAFLTFFFRVNPMFDSLHSDPRFADLLRRVGLPPREQEAKSREQ